MLTGSSSALTPKYPLGCKRVAFDAGWLESLHRPNVDLVNHPIVQVTPRGLVTSDGVEKEFDVIIFATVRSRSASILNAIADLDAQLRIGIKRRGTRRWSERRLERRNRSRLASSVERDRWTEGVHGNGGTRGECRDISYLAMSLTLWRSFRTTLSYSDPTLLPGVGDIPSGAKPCSTPSSSRR